MILQNDSNAASASRAILGTLSTLVLEKNPFQKLLLEWVISFLCLNKLHPIRRILSAEEKEMAHFSQLFVPVLIHLIQKP